MKTNTDDGSTYLRRMTAAAFTVASTLVTGVACLMLSGTGVACNNASSHQRGSIAILYPDGSVFRSSDDNTATANAPLAATQPAVATSDRHASAASTSGVPGPLAKTLTDYAGEKLWLFYAGAVLSVFGAVFAFRKAHPFEGMVFLAAAGAMAMTPTLLVGFESIAVEAAAVLIGLAVVLLIGRKLGSVREKARQGVATVQVALEQAAAGETENALGTLVSHPDIKPVVDQASK